MHGFGQRERENNGKCVWEVGMNMNVYVSINIPYVKECTCVSAWVFLCVICDNRKWFDISFNTMGKEMKSTSHSNDNKSQERTAAAAAGGGGDTILGDQTSWEIPLGRLSCPVLSPWVTYVLSTWHYPTQNSGGRVCCGGGQDERQLIPPRYCQEIKTSRYPQYAYEGTCCV